MDPGRTCSMALLVASMFIAAPFAQRATDHRGSERVATDHHGSERVATDHRGSERVATDHHGSERVATDHSGSERVATDHRGSERVATDHRGSEQVATDHHGSEQVPVEAEKAEKKDKNKDKDSVELVVTGCLKGRALQAEDVRPAKEDEQVPVIQARTFRVNGAREVLDEVKKQNNRYVEATGRVKRSALTAPGPGISVGGARITVTPGSMGNPSRAPQYDTNAGVLHIEVTTVRVLGENCSLK